MSQSAQHLVWIDLEMTGLDPAVETILEIATLVTDNDLRVLAEGPNLAIHQPDSVLDGMDEWCTEHHGASGLTARVRASDVTMADAEQRTLDFLEPYFEPGKAILCGNSIGQDRRFIRKYMTKLDAFLHYRMLDVSTVKILAQRWYPEDWQAPAKKEAHLALDDIRESVAELAHYRTKLFRPAP